MPVLRRYCAADWDAFLALDLDTGSKTLRYVSEEEREAFRARWPDVLRERFGWGEHGPTVDAASFWVLDDEGAYAGHVWLSEQRDLRTGVVRLWINTMSIAAPYRSRGWARLLMERAEQEAAERGLDGIGLAVDADNVVARKLYEELGFETVRLRMVKSRKR